MSETETKPAETDTADQAEEPKAKRGKPAADVATVKLNLAIAGIGYKDDVVELPTEEADALVAMGHADPVVDGEPVEVQRVEPPAEGEQPLVETPVEQPEGISTKRIPAKKVAAPKA